MKPSRVRVLLLTLLCAISCATAISIPKRISLTSAIHAVVIVADYGICPPHP